MKIKKMPEPIQLEIPITTDFIKLESFLKFAGASETGGEAKNSIQNGEVTVDGQVCTMRGKKLTPGMEVSLDGSIYRVTKGESADCI